MTTSTTCVICERPVDGVAYGCAACADRARRHLATIADLAPDARAVAHGQTSRGPSGAGGGSGERRLPVNLAATSRLDAVQGELTTLVRAVAAERGRVVPLGGDPISIAATWLSGHAEWWRHQQWVDEAFGTIATCERVIAGIVDRPAPVVIVGACECGEWVYGRQGAATATCRGCDVRYDVASSRDDLWAAALDKTLTAAQIATLAARAGHDRQRARNLVTTWGKRGVVATVDHDDEGAPRYRLGDAWERLERLAAERLVVAG